MPAASLRYVPYDKLDGVPNIIVDGSPHKDSKLVLSHWIDSGTPPELMRDISAQIVLDYLESRGLPTCADAVSNDHFDQDGLIALYALLCPQEAMRERDFLIDVATAGDFGKYSNRKAAHVSMLIAALLDPSHRHFEEGLFSKPYPEQSSRFYETLLEELPGLLSAPEKYQSLYQEEAAFLADSESLISSGSVQIEDVPELDLAVVRMPADLPRRAFHRFTKKVFGHLHDMAIHNSTGRSRIVSVCGRSLSFKYRYESWVQLEGVRPKLRVSLATLAAGLSAWDDCPWEYQGSAKLVAELRTVGNAPSSLSEGRFLGALFRALRAEAVDWNPYR